MSRSCARFVSVGSVFVGALLMPGLQDPWCASPAELAAGSVLQEVDLLRSSGFDESGDAVRQERLRDSAVRVASRVDSLLGLLESSDPGDDSPGEEGGNLIDAWLHATARALLHEANRLDLQDREDLQVAGDVFYSLWNRRADRILSVLRRWPRLWSEPVPGGGDGVDLPAQLVLFCTPAAYRGESFSLPRRFLFRRMAELPDSIARCCLTDIDCRRKTGVDCHAGVVAAMARQPDLDLLVGFAHMNEYWSLPANEPPRSPATDAMVAHAEVRAAERLLAGAQEEGERLPEGIDPRSTVPGLRNPRRLENGRLVWDLILHGEARRAYEARWGDERLRALSGKGRLIESD